MVPFTKTFHRLRVIGLTSLIVVSVVLFGCKSDKDGDRVEDAKDECDNARGVAVDANGCPCADSAALPEPLPIAAVRMYVDNSGSMRDFTNPTSLFRSTISECISRIQKMKTDNIADTVRYHLIASSLLHTDYNILYKAIRTGDIMKAKSTPILSMIEQVQHRHEAQDISVLVSDFELSEKDADNLDLALKTDVLAQIAKHNAVGLYAFREKSVDRPYYVMVIGTSASVLLFDREGGLRDYRHKIFLGVKYPVPEIAFLNYSQRDETTWFISQDFCRTIEDASLAGKGYIQFAMGLDLKKYEGLQLDSVYLTKNTLIKDVDPQHVADRGDRAQPGAALRPGVMKCGTPRSLKCVCDHVAREAGVSVTPTARSGRRRGVAGLPGVGEPVVEVAGLRFGKICQQLREVALRVDVVAAAGAREAGENGTRPAAARAAHEQTVLAIEHDAFHLALARVVVDRHGAILGEHRQRLPLVQRMLHRLGHRVPGKQLITPGVQAILERVQHRPRLALAKRQTPARVKIACLFFDAAELSDQFDGLGGHFRPGRLGLDELAASVG